MNKELVELRKDEPAGNIEGMQNQIVFDKPKSQGGDTVYSALQKIVKEFNAVWTAVGNVVMNLLPDITFIGNGDAGVKMVLFNDNQAKKSGIRKANNKLDFTVDGVTFDEFVGKKDLEAHYLKCFPKMSCILWLGNENEVPDGWYICNGQLVNGVAIPDVRGMVPVQIGVGQDMNDRKVTFGAGKNNGEYAHTQTLDEMFSHKHTGAISLTAGGTAFGGGATYDIHDEKTAGNSQPFNVLQPTYGVHFIIRIF